MGAWEPHGSSWYNCNRYNVSQEEIIRSLLVCLCLVPLQLLTQSQTHPAVAAQPAAPGVTRSDIIYQTKPLPHTFLFSLTFAGCVWDHGSHTPAPGTIVTGMTYYKFDRWEQLGFKLILICGLPHFDFLSMFFIITGIDGSSFNLSFPGMMKTRQELTGTTRRRAGVPCRGTCSTATGRGCLCWSLWLLFFNLFRYMNHLQSLKFESKLYAMVKDKMEEMQQHNMSWIEVQFLKKSLDILCECRRTLMYTYVFAYYLRKNNQSAIFEVSQLGFLC